MSNFDRRWQKQERKARLGSAVFAILLVMMLVLAALLGADG